MKQTIKDAVDKTIGHVDKYYHRHKRDTNKPKIWDLIVAVRYLAHENISLNKYPRLRCGVDGCGSDPIVFVYDVAEMLYCEHHSQRYGYCPTCGFSYEDDDNYCTMCEHNQSKQHLHLDFEIDDYDKDHLWDN